MPRVDAVVRSQRGSASSDGYVLLTCLWLLILGGTIAAAVLADSLSTARTLQAQEALWRRRLAAEEAVEQITYDLLRNGRRSRWVRDPGLPTIVETSNGTVSVAVSWEAGRVDLNSADADIVRRVYAFAGAKHHWQQTAIATLTDKRVVMDRRIGLLREVPGAEEHFAGCLLPLITLWTDLPVPEAGVVDPLVQEATGLPASMTPNEMTAASSLAGQALRLDVKLLGEMPTRLTAVIRLTGSLAQPYWFQAWEWNLPTNDNCRRAYA